MIDKTEAIRREQQDLINGFAGEREVLEDVHGQVWSTGELGRDYTVKGFMAPYVVVERKSDHKVGSLMFQASPRFYFGFKEDE